MTPGAEKLFADCARRRTRGLPLDGGSIPPISTISTPGFRWKPGVFCAQVRALQRIAGRGSLRNSAYSMCPCRVLVVVFTQCVRAITAPTIVCNCEIPGSTSSFGVMSTPIGSIIGSVGRTEINRSSTVISYETDGRPTAAGGSLVGSACQVCWPDQKGCGPVPWAVDYWSCTLEAIVVV